MRTAIAGTIAVVALILFIGAGIYTSALSLVTAAGQTATAAVEGTAENEGTAAAFTGTSTGCTEPDPTTSAGCLTPAMAWLYSQVEQHFGHQSTHCWDPHLQNPTSDHPKGRACDITIGRTGTFPNATDTAHGWDIANWLRANATALHVSYVIWDAHIWSVSHDNQGWRTYTGGGIYDVTTPTGGHYDHVHVSTRE